MTVTAFLGTIAGSYCGFLFSRHSPDGLGYISMLTTVFLGVKFLVKPITGGTDASAAAEQSGLQDLPLRCCRLRHRLGSGFTGSGGGILMLTVLYARPRL